MNNDFIIPVDSAIQEFSSHLECHPRTILSARYGDGKSYFIDAFMKSPAVKKKYQVLKLYPVNYQVLDNRDIFDIIKYDVLLQLGLNDMLDPSIEISTWDAILFCMKSQGLNLLDSLFNIASCFDGTITVKAIGKIGKGMVGVIKNIQDALKDYKKGDSNFIDSFISYIDETTIYDEDPITKIIQKNIESWRKKRENENKRIVLLFEDMDRIDPAHLFRILNVFSAHMDYSYKYAVEPGESLIGNKFGVDNVVIVLDYNNLKSIFHHFYGERTCFEGYIHKFADKGQYNYSLQAESIKYFYQCLAKVTNLSEDIIKEILNVNKLIDRSLRELSSSLDNIKQQRKRVKKCSYDITALMVCMRRLGLVDNEIVRCFTRVIEQNKTKWMEYLYPYLKHLHMIEDHSIQLVDSNETKSCYYFKENPNMIQVVSSGYVNQNTVWEVTNIVKTVLTLVSK